MEFSRPEYWSRQPFPSPGDLPNLGIKSRSLTLQAILYHLSHQGSPRCAVLSHVLLSVTPWTVGCQVPLSMGILQARILEWVAMPSSRGSSLPRDRTNVSYIAGKFFTSEPPEKSHLSVWKVIMKIERIMLMPMK